MTQMRHLAKHSVSLCVAAPFWLKRETKGSPTNVQVLSIAASSCRGLPLPISAQKSLYTNMTSHPGYEIVREPLECPVHGNRKCQCVALKDKRTGRVYFTSMEILKLMHSVPGAAGDPATKQCGGTANVEPQPDPANRTRHFEGIPNAVVHWDPCKKEKTSPAPQRKCDGAPLKRVKYDHESDSSDANYRQNDDAKPRRRSPPPLPPPPPPPPPPPAAAPKWSSNGSKLFHAGVPPARTGTGRPSEHQSHHNRRGVRRHLPLRGTRKHQPVRDIRRVRPLRGTRRHQPVRDIRRRQPMRNLFSADLHRSTPKGADAR